MVKNFGTMYLSKDGKISFEEEERSKGEVWKMKEVKADVIMLWCCTQLV